MEKKNYMIVHVKLLSPFVPPTPLTESATLAASVNASFTPRFRFAEHSISPGQLLVNGWRYHHKNIPKYRSACIRRATSRPCE